MDLFTYLMAKKGHNTHRGLFSYLLGKNAGGSGTYTTFSGTSLNISNTLQAKIKNIALEENTSQDGTPTPDTPIPIKVVTGGQSIKIHNKNLFDKDNDVTLKTQASFSGKEDNEFTTSSSNIRTLIITRVPSNSEITLSINNNNYIQSRYFICQLKTPTIEAGKNEKWYTGNSTIVTTDKTNYLGIVLEIKKNGTTVNSTQEAIDEIKFQTEKGTTATPYKPYYTPQTYPLSLGNIELAGINDYKDYIFKNEVGSPYYNANLDLNDWYLHKEMGKITLSNSDSFTLDSYSLRFTKVLDTIYEQGGYSNRYIYGGTYQATGKFEILSNSRLAFNYPDSNIDTVTELQTYLTTNELYMYLPLATPTNTKITDTTLISQLENINNNARSYKDTTIIECTSASADNETIGFSGEIKVTSVGLGNSLNTSLLSSNLQEETNIDDIQEEPNLDDVNEIEDIEQNDEPIENEVS